MLAEEILDAHQAWNEVPDLMMEAKGGRMIPEAAINRKREEVAWGWRKQQREDEIRQEKCEHSPPQFQRGHLFLQDLLRRVGRVTTRG